MALTIIYCADKGCDAVLSAAAGTGLVSLGAKHNVLDRNGKVKEVHQGALHLYLTDAKWEPEKFANAGEYLAELRRLYPKAKYADRLVAHPLERRAALAQASAPATRPPAATPKPAAVAKPSVPSKPPARSAPAKREAPRGRRR